MTILDIILGLFGGGFLLAIGFWVGWRQGIREAIPRAFWAGRGLELLAQHSDDGDAKATITISGVTFIFSAKDPGPKNRRGLKLIRGGKDGQEE